jgi:predicted MFS family arabinose efflux permease
MSSVPDRSASTAAAASDRGGLWLALVLSLGAAVSLGVTRFAYGLLLPPMREDLGWSYTLAGSMNTFNALGYLLGALSTPWLMRRLGPGRLLLWGAALASVFMAGSGFFVDATPLMVQRLLAGWASAWVFIAGGLLAARLGAHWPRRSGLLLGLYYGGTGWGIVASAVSVPWVLQAMAERPHAWAWAWWWLAGLCVLATLALGWVVRAIARHDTGVTSTATPGASAATGNALAGPSLWQFTPALAGYTLFGVGYIGYMTFVIALLKDQHHAAGAITFFYSLLGLAVVASSRIWAGLLDRHKNGQPLARLNGLLGVATVLPALTASWPVLLLSGLLFGAVFLSVVASTTALVRHNLPPARWAAGISAFTIVFAAGQIVGPTVVGLIADGPGGLERGLLFSAVALWVGAALAWRQKALV